MTHVKGIGGVFIDSNDPVQLAAWYTEVLGIELEGHPDGKSYYRVFFTRDPETGVTRGNPVFAINPSKSVLTKEGRGFILNLRVDDLETLLEQLRARGDVEVEDRLLVWERGKHAWIRDLDGNRVELYEELFPDDASE